MNTIVDVAAEAAAAGFAGWDGPVLSPRGCRPQQMLGVIVAANHVGEFPSKKAVVCAMGARSSRGRSGLADKIGSLVGAGLVVNDGTASKYRLRATSAGCAEWLWWSEQGS